MGPDRTYPLDPMRDGTIELHVTDYIWPGDGKTVSERSLYFVDNDVAMNLRISQKALIDLHEAIEKELGDLLYNTSRGEFKR